MKFAIVVIGYNRVDSISRLLESLKKAEYCGDTIDLIISIDNSGTDQVEIVARDTEWICGEKKIYTYEARQGLRKHILGCGRFLDEYDAIAVLEDDIIVSPSFYEYMREAVSFYKDDRNIAGISLYGYSINENNMLPFKADYSEFDTYFIQYASSWGQIWMKDQWQAFYNWYLQNSEEFLDAEHIPYNVSSWPKTSWKKYHIKYCIENNKFFVYPYMSLSTCYSDAGQHTFETSIALQTQLLYTYKKGYNFAPLSADNAVKYDAFFERVLPRDECLLSIPYRDICMDLYGFRRSWLGKRYVISTKDIGYKIVSTFGGVFEPQERNVMQNVPGNLFFLYDMSEKMQHKQKLGYEHIYRYHVFANKKNLIYELLREKFRTIIRKMLK